MNLTDAQLYAHKMMDTRGLREIGWTFEFDKAVRRFGACHYRYKKITISRKLTELNNEDEVFDTILHEIAHAIAGRNAGHGYEWQCVARVLGCSAERTYSSQTVTIPPKKWIGKCPNCGREVKKHRRSKTMACGQCCRNYNNNRWSSAYVFDWRINDEQE